MHATGALASLVDARLVAAAVWFDAGTSADPVGSPRRRAAAPAAALLAGIAGALDVAATVLDVM
ncbi:hypothetical protein [Mycobacterium paraintracellulare]|uniref:hypothetical protein n=1 Tax=Mycobacterium paraintracellulare TaxID=1138383 RepID=UPI003891F0FA